jgi:hypothetical protein
MSREDGNLARDPLFRKVCHEDNITVKSKDQSLRKPVTVSRADLPGKGLAWHVHVSSPNAYIYIHMAAMDILVVSMFR